MNYCTVAPACKYVKVGNWSRCNRIVEEPSTTYSMRSCPRASNPLGSDVSPSSPGSFMKEFEAE